MLSSLTSSIVFTIILERWLLKPVRFRCCTGTPGFREGTSEVLDAADAAVVFSLSLLEAFLEAERPTGFDKINFTFAEIY